MSEIEELKTENEKLRSINEVKSDLISISAHQLRTSLTAVKWILKMFIDKDLGSITHDQEDYINKAFTGNQRMITLVNDLLTLNNADSLATQFNFQKVKIEGLIEETLAEFSGETHKRKIELLLQKSDGGLPEVNCDINMIRVVLQNLIENAIKYSNDGDKVSVATRYNEGKNEIEISVHDNGIGIKKEDQGNIFSKFFRASNAKEKDCMGSGLGLFTTKNIVERHHGKIWFESNGDNGTTFYITLSTSFSM
jgi:signal transduction histidine kinase